ncbi:pentatricopeptide repeat-containing protein At1g33350 [Oryza sativa Japonica Group]|uniref:Os02g0620800 protein n=2 Tax=Oryza TaxID=4527 RepID=Q6K9G0_ORYSJ|nr:pentatricopeptide repeat-containing protein At1g33350 [Oryza sativa Japonica Group]XP_015623629.1 pentatricopeptide repeat-containing protein At1g33350 [Oryza sativa Japonica Group]BAD21535.1 putative pentatricopeptide (PPR) repeat-containing protein [Oryza sativa Japonica Group]BAD21575.1 putative pentatricopeptide (PPR) repeat-containing protein [Oryza sativa Japonica Group]BAF09371.1 Os02g0620800 [Oryza sativa Japonica Group]|eukprot:NP_001047457.1 Os02g0620800 [Oryza sativa Japonica Group]
MPPAPPFSSHGDFVAALHRCATLAHLKQLHAHAVVTGRAAAQTTTFHLLRFASLRLSCLPYARRLFDATPSPNVFLYSAMLSAYAAASSHSQEHARDSLALFLRMLRRGRPAPNQFVYPLVLRAACAIGVQLVRSIHCHACKDGFYGHDFIRTSLLDGYSRYGMMGDARKLFDGLTDRNVVSWTALVSGYARAGKVGDAIVLFERMPQRDVPAWNAIIAGCTQNGLFVEAVGIFRRMVDEGFRPNGTTVSCLLSACGHLGMLKIGKVIHGYAWRSCVGFGSSVVNGLIDMYGKCGNLMEAKWIFDAFSDRGLTTWNSLINCLALHGCSESAIAVFNSMRNEGVQPDEVTFVGLLNACTHGGFVDEGLRYFELMCDEHGIEPEIEHYGCVVDLLCRAGRFQDAMNFINDMKVQPDEVIWGSLLNACRIHRHLELAEHAIRNLLDLNPSNANYVVMLANLYSEGGFWEEVRKVRKLMKEDVTGKKLPGCSWIEVDRKTRRFYSGDDGHPESEDIYDTLDKLATTMEMQATFA